MATGTLSQLDLQIRDAVSKELVWDSEVDATAIGVAARDGAVTTDEDIARDVVSALEFHGTELDHVQATVHQGQLTLTGNVPSSFKRSVAENAVKHITGVRHVINRVDVVSTASPEDVQREITRALHRRADVGAHGIEVSVTGNRVRLTGTVNSWSERLAAEEAASHAPGIAVVANDLGVRMDEGPVEDEC
jgi:osmotically-inducible protein OsmY